MKVVDVMYYTYILRCRDNSLYTGITNNLKRRMEEHFRGTKKCAKYTLRHTPIKIEMVWSSPNRITASKLEYRIKRLKKEEKEMLLQNESYFSILFGNVLDCEVYKKEKINAIIQIDEVVSDERILY